MPNRAYVVIASIPGTLKLYVAVAGSEADAHNIIAQRQGARSGEDVTVASILSDDAARKIGADLSRAGLYANFTPGQSN